MHLLSYISFGIALSSPLVSGSLHNLQKRYSKAPFSPTGCTTYPPVSTPTEKCSLSSLGLPNYGTTTVTYTSSTTAASWRTPAPSANWQIILDKEIEFRFPTDGKVVDGVEVYDIDLDSSKATFDSYGIAKGNNKNMYLICYFSAGTSEKARLDYPCFNVNPGQKDYACNYGGNSPDEYWLNMTSPDVRLIMLERLRQAAAKGCDAVDPDNIDGYSEGNNNGIGETFDDAFDMMKFLATEAHHRGLAIGLKNSNQLAKNSTIVNLLDFAVVEECFTNLDDNGALSPSCGDWSLFYDHSKPVYSIEYPITSDNETADRFPWSESAAAARCSAWATFNKPLIKVDLKNFYNVNCGVARCVSGGPNPALTKTTGKYTSICSKTTVVYTTTAGLVTPSGCSQIAAPTLVNCDG